MPADLREIAATLDVLCRYYRDKHNEPRQLDDVQATVYADGLCEFDALEIESAARQWMRTSRWFPALSDLRAILTGPPTDWEALALIAWATFERAVSAAGVYRGVTFEDPSIGEAVRQTFGSWEHACSYDRDSPGWTIRRQTFVSIFPLIAVKATAPVTLRGLSPVDPPLVIQHVAALPEPKKLLTEQDKSVSVLAEVARRFKLAKGNSPDVAS